MWNSNFQKQNLNGNKNTTHLNLYYGNEYNQLFIVNIVNQWATIANWQKQKLKKWHYNGDSLTENPNKIK